jgi:hypothetical protein
MNSRTYVPEMSNLRDIAMSVNFDDVADKV